MTGRDRTISLVIEVKFKAIICPVWCQSSGVSGLFGYTEFVRGEGAANSCKGKLTIHL